MNLRPEVCVGSWVGVDLGAGGVFGLCVCVYLRRISITPR